MSNEQRIVHFAGMVQGVGFRYTTCRLAGDYNVTGYVRNLPDGRVECVAEGSSGQIDAFLEELSRHMSHHISRQSQQRQPYTGRFVSFGVRY